MDWSTATKDEIEALFREAGQQVKSVVVPEGIDYLEAIKIRMKPLSDLEQQMIDNTVFRTPKDISIGRCKVLYVRDNVVDSGIRDIEYKHYTDVFRLNGLGAYTRWLKSQVDEYDRNYIAGIRKTIKAGDVLLSENTMSRSLLFYPQAVEVMRVNQKTVTVQELNLRENGDVVEARRGDWYDNGWEPAIWKVELGGRDMELCRKFPWSIHKEPDPVIVPRSR